MFGLGPATKIYLAVEAMDMRKGFEGLFGAVRDELGQDPLSGHLFLFTNKTRTRLKALVWDVGSWMYDSMGNVLQVAAMSRAFSYDAENRQVTAAVNGNSDTYTYDGDGRRVIKTTTSSGLTTTTIYVYDAEGQVAQEYSTGAATDTGTSYFTADALGSTRVVTGADGSVKRRYDYLPFGEGIYSGIDGRTTAMGYNTAMGVTIPDIEHDKFTSKERDAETGLDYFGARYMSSAQGRFTSADPALFPHDITDPQSWNKYSYTRNNPLRYVDPDGADWQDYVKGAINAFTSDNTAGVGRISNGTNGDFQRGQAIGDAVATFTGAVETFVGGGGEALGVALDATGIGATIGVPVNVVSAGVIAHGATTSIEGGGNLLSSALGPKEGVSGGPGGGKRVDDKTKQAALDENQAANGGQAKCVFCGDPVGEGTGNKINYDHATPKSQNGSGTDVNNVNVTCEYCNKSKGTGTEPKNPKPPKTPDQQ